MFERFKGRDRKIVAGLKDTGTVEAYIESVVSLAKRLDMSLKFTNVVEPRNSLPILHPGEYVRSGLSQAAEEKRISETIMRLEEVLKPFLGKWEFEKSVQFGRPAEVLKSDALSSRASLVVCGVKSTSQRLVSKGFATATELMAESSIPVLVIPEGKVYDFNKKVLNVLVCDDLTQTSAEALPVAAELSGSLRNTKLHHLHIHGESKQQLVDWARQISDMMMTRDLDYRFVVNKDTIVAETEKAVYERMAKRLDISPSFLKMNSVAIEQEVRFGDVFDELTKSIESLSPDLIVFGRHQFLHKYPVSIGKVPFYTMLNLDLPIMVVSNIGQLYFSGGADNS